MYCIGQGLLALRGMELEGVTMMTWITIMGRTMFPDCTWMGLDHPLKSVEVDMMEEQKTEEKIAMNWEQLCQIWHWKGLGTDPWHQWAGCKTPASLRTLCRMGLNCHHHQSSGLNQKLEITILSDDITNRPRNRSGRFIRWRHQNLRQPQILSQLSKDNVNIKTTAKMVQSLTVEIPWLSIDMYRENAMLTHSTIAQSFRASESEPLIWFDARVWWSFPPVVLFIVLIVVSIDVLVNPFQLYHMGLRRCKSNTL